jgi:hypothetical protein
MYDVNSSRYVGDGLVFGGTKPPKYFLDSGDNPILRDDFYTMQSLQQQSSR